MLKDKPIVAFIVAKDAERARQFYESTLGLTFVEDTPFALLFDLRGIQLRVTRVEELTPSQHTVLGWDVGDVPAAVRELVAKGVTFEHYEGFGQDEDGIWSAPDGTKVAWFKDPDGNLLSVSQNPPA
jgi:catechol 2,3-dioxygenase-like lactoylglutathione lyase family enzyme